MNVENKLDIFKSAGLATVGAPEAKKKNSLGPDDFLRLMTTQMKFQNPLKPQDGAEILNQLSQLSSITGMQELQKTFSQFTNLMTSDQALRAAGLVGHPVLIRSASGTLPPGGALQGNLALPASSSDVRVSVTSGTGELLKTLKLGAQSGGEVPFVWNGLREDSTPAPPGVYTLKAEALIDGKNTALETRAIARVNSVRLGAPGEPMELNLAGLGQMGLDKVLEIY
jgi:flagellar basal-body rod modification protein FlgD